MLDANIWIQGLTTMLVGMGIVFTFLVILVFAIFILAKCVAVIDKICPVAVPVAKIVKKTSSSDDSEVAVAIAVAMAQG